MKKHKQAGFTIVELLIVIVVIGILAAIVIVSFNGVQNRANQSSVQSLIATVEKKAILYRATTGQLPSADQFRNNLAPGSTVTNSGPPEARLDGLTVTTYTVGGTPPQAGDTPSAANGTKVVRYVFQDANCAWIDWWNHGTNSITTLSTTPSSKRIGC